LRLALALDPCSPDAIARVRPPPRRSKSEGFAGGWLPATVLRAATSADSHVDVEYAEARALGARASARL
jgi:hypothetical protein